MINFFRKIRHRLLASDRISKYFIYAIGEIVLVVIGILIALQINNWNNDQQSRQSEREILEELKQGLQEDKQLLEKMLLKYRLDYQAMLELDSLLKISDFPYSAKMDRLFGKVYGIRFVRVNVAFYEDLKTTGLQIIRNKSIRSKVVRLFENNYRYLDGILENERNTNQIVRPYYLEHFTNLDFLDSAHPIDYQKIWNDPKYKNIVHYRIITLQSNQLDNYQKTIDKIDNLVSEISTYFNEF